MWRSESTNSKSSTKIKEEREDELIAQTPKTDTNLYNIIKAIKRANPKVGPLFNQAAGLEKKPF